MKTLQVTTWDAVGQNFNGYKLHQALRVQGHDSHMAVMSSSLDDPAIHELEGPILLRANRFLSRAERFLSLHSVLPVASLALYGQPWYYDADLLHLQLLHGGQFFSLFNLPIMSRKRPCLWTLHDPWMTTGHCIHPLDCPRWQTGCGSCPDLGLPIVARGDNTALAWKIKRWVMARGNIELVVSSPWMEQRVSQSPILGHLPVHRIPFGLDPAIFHEQDKAACRAAFAIPPKAKVLAFRESAPSYRLKGIEYIVQALERLEASEPVFMLAFEGRGEVTFPRHKYVTIELGWVNDPQLLATALGAADMFLMPSLAESFGLMAVEAMACGTVPIVFEGTALPGVIGDGGVTVPSQDSEALAGAIARLWDDEQEYAALRDRGLEIVKQDYTLELYVRRHLELYQGLVERARGG